MDNLGHSIKLRGTLRRDEIARIYPVTRETSRIAVFYPLMILWREDPEAAQAVLRHELAHRRQGDDLIVGLGSPFVRLIRVWIAVFAFLVLVPLALYFAVWGGRAAAVLTGQGILQLVQAPTALILPVAGLWLAELGADRLTSREAGSDALQRALQKAHTDASWVDRVLAFVSHPPRQLRVRMAPGQPASTAVLLTAWQAAVIAQLLLTITAALPGYLLTGEPARTIASDLLTDTHQLLLTNRLLLIAITYLLIRWPDWAGRWQRCWSPVNWAPPPGPWPLYLASAALPAAFAILSFA